MVWTWCNSRRGIGSRKGAASEDQDCSRSVMIRQRFSVVAWALMSCVVAPAMVHAQACPGKGATLTGTLRVERHQHPNGTMFQPWMLQLPSPTCLMVAGLDDKSPPQRFPTISRVQLGAASEQQTAQ